MAQRAGGRAVACTQDLTGFLRMYEDGLAESEPHVFSRTMRFADISYDHERDDVKDDLYRKYRAVHKSFKEGTAFQINLINIPSARPADRARYLSESGANADYARAFNELLEERWRAGRVEFDRENYITFAIAADDEDEASRLLRTQEDTIRPLFARLQSRIESVDGCDRAHLVFKLLHDAKKPFLLDYADIARRTRRVRDYVAPAWAAYADGDTFVRKQIYLPDACAKVYWIKDFGSSIEDDAIRSIRALPIPMNISLLHQPQPAGAILKRIAQNIDVAQAAINDYANSIAKSGGDPTRLPPALEAREEDARELKRHIEGDNQGVVWFQGMIAVYARDDATMRVYEQMLMDDAARWSIELAELPLQQEQALVSTLPFATPRLPRKFRSLTTSESAALVPFASQNVHDEPARSLLLGVDTVSGDDILVDPDRLKSPHMWVFGITGSGKGMEMNTMLTYSLLQHPRTELADDGTWRCPDSRCPQWHVFDFHGEYLRLARDFDGTVATFGPGRPDAINPLGISNAAGELTSQVVVENIDFFLALCESVMGCPLTMREKSLLDECLGETFEPYLGGKARPTLKDLYAALVGRGPDAQALADAWRIFVEGSMGSFARETSFAVHPQLNIYNMAEVGHQMKTIAMLSALQHVRTCAFANFRQGKPTYLVLEEVQVLFDSDASVRILDSYFSELRKYGLHIICVTQLPERVLRHPQATYLFQNSGAFIFLPMSMRDAATIAEMFRLSETQHDLIKQSADPGTGLVVADGVKVAMSNRIPKANLLYEVWNTDPDRLAGKQDGKRDDG